MIVLVINTPSNSNDKIIKAINDHPELIAKDLDIIFNNVFTYILNSRLLIPVIDDLIKTHKADVLCISVENINIIALLNIVRNSPTCKLVLSPNFKLFRGFQSLTTVFNSKNENTSVFK